MVSPNVCYLRNNLIARIMTQQFQTALQAFQDHATGAKTKEFGLPKFEVATVEDLQDCTKELHALQSALRASDKEARLTSAPGKYVALTYGGLTLRVQTPKVAKKTNVAQTSRDAYKTVDLGERCEVVARAAIKLGVCTDNDVAREIGMPANLVSGRRNNIEDAGGIMIDGVIYVLKMSGVAKRDPITKRSGNVWFLEEAFENFKPVSEPSPVGEQTELFT